MVRVKIASYDVRELAYFRFFLKNATQFIVGYHAGPVVVEVAIDGVGDDIEFLVSHDGRLAGLRFRARHLLDTKSTELSCLKLLSVIEDVVLCHVDLANHRF